MSDQTSDAITLAGVLADAHKLAAEQKAIKGRVAANRQLATLLVKNGKGTPDEREAVTKLYPSHKPKTAPTEPTEPTEPEQGAHREPGPTADELPATGLGSDPAPPVGHEEFKAKNKSAPRKN